MKSDLTINKVETEESLYGPVVKVIRTIKDQDSGIRTETIELRAYFAVDEVLRGVDLGITCISAHIDFNGSVDLWGQSL